MITHAHVARVCGAQYRIVKPTASKEEIEQAFDSGDIQPEIFTQQILQVSSCYTSSAARFLTPMVPHKLLPAGSGTCSGAERVGRHPGIAYHMHLDKALQLDVTKCSAGAPS